MLNRQRSNIIALLLTQPRIFPWTLYPALRIADARESNYFDRPFLEKVPEYGVWSTDQGLSEPRRGRGRLRGDPDAPGLSAAHKGRITGLSPFQASVGLRQLARFPRWLEKQVKNARLLRYRLENCPGLQLQQEPSGTRSSFLYVRARVDDPGKVRHALLLKGVDTKPDDMRNCAGLKIFGDQMLCPNAARLGGHCIEIPCSHIYSERQINRLADRVLSVSSRF